MDSNSCKFGILLFGQLVLCILVLFPFSSKADSVAEPESYRNENYRAPVPSTLGGATVIDTESAFVLWESGNVVFVDVMPQAPKPKNLPKGTIWRDKPRTSIKGSYWFPNVGYGKLADETDSYFRSGLESATNGNKSKPILIFCLQECWMSWNAAKRAMEYGYTDVFWYPDGVDGWMEYLYPTENVKPEEPESN